MRRQNQLFKIRGSFSLPSASATKRATMRSGLMMPSYPASIRKYLKDMPLGCPGISAISEKGCLSNRLSRDIGKGVDITTPQFSGETVNSFRLQDARSGGGSLPIMKHLRSNPFPVTVKRIQKIDESLCRVLMIIIPARPLAEIINGCSGSIHLGYHFKSGHTLSLQKRPTEVTQNKTYL